MGYFVLPNPTINPTPADILRAASGNIELLLEQYARGNTTYMYLFDFVRHNLDRAEDAMKVMNEEKNK